MAPALARVKIAAELAAAIAVPAMPGVFELSVRVPASARAGNLRVLLRAGSSQSQDGVTMAVQ